MILPKVEVDGTQLWFKDEYHRDGGPAVMWPDGTQFWCKDGKLHNDAGPAVVYSDGFKRWLKDGVEYDTS